MFLVYAYSVHISFVAMIVVVLDIPRKINSYVEFSNTCLLLPALPSSFVIKKFRVGFFIELKAKKIVYKTCILPYLHDSNMLQIVMHR